MKKFFPFLFLLFISVQIFAQNKDYQTITNIHYYDETANKSDVYINERCVLDVYIPKNVKNFSTVIWFHGGGLTGGNKEIPKYLQEKGIAVIGVNYRLSPKVNAAKAIDDAAAATAWVFKNIKNYGGNENLIFISGHSAGGYLASMVALNKDYLAKYNIDANNWQGLFLSADTLLRILLSEKKSVSQSINRL